MQEASKALIRRLHDVRYVNTYFRGAGIDIGCGPDPITKHAQQFPLMTTVKEWDLADGDAQYMASVADETFNFVHSSHCLEHLHDPYIAFSNWIRICKSGGYIVVTIPDEDLYEQGGWPSSFNPDHKTTWTISKPQTWSPVSNNVFDFLGHFNKAIEVLKVELINSSFNYNQQRYDQTYHGISECAIEFVVRKKSIEEISRGGRLPF
jgi:SAM-dependent methyltransferase